MKKISNILKPNISAVRHILSAQIGLILISAIFIILSYQCFDQPLAYMAENNNLRQYSILEWLTYLDFPIKFLVFVALPVLLIRHHFHKRNYHDQAALAISLSVVITIFFKDVLKFIFGRYWPATWLDDNLSLIRDGAYGFTWLQENPAYQSFPSGHMAVMAAAMVALALFYPRLKYFSWLMIILMIAGQLGLHYHFLSDIIAGGLLGYIAALNTVLFMSRQPKLGNQIN
jgi:membrane-associated phospholipid phosphatase